MGLPRIIEIDILRGIAVGGMILYHFLFDLDFFGILSLDLDTGFWFWFARAAAFTFVFLAGFSCVLYAYRKKESLSLHRRGLILFAWGLLITAITFITFPEYTIWFGALHLIGLGVFLSPFFVGRPLLSGGVGVFIFLLGIAFSMGWVPFPFVLGVFPISIQTFDYFPLFPWAGVFLLGIGLGARTHSYFTHRPTHNEKKQFPPFQTLAWMGTNSLLIYLIHQPILLGLLFMLRVF